MHPITDTRDIPKNVRENAERLAKTVRAEVEKTDPLPDPACYAVRLQHYVSLQQDVE